MHNLLGYKTEMKLALFLAQNVVYIMVLGTVILITIAILYLKLSVITTHLKFIILASVSRVMRNLA